jgi:hypothetical protein
MSVRPQEVTVGEVKFRITPFDPWTQLRLFGDLQKEILPHVGGMLSAAFGAENGQRDEQAAIQAFRDLSANLGGAVLEKWAKLLLDPDYVTFEMNRAEPAKLTQVNFGMALPDFAAMLELMYHVGRVNFAGPLSRWAGLSGLAQKAREHLSGSFATTSSANS